jgi:uncharacterized YccA/Bax inhibitor family protein
VANPVLNDKTFTSVRQENAGWAAPDPRAGYAPPPMVDSTNRMTMSGTMSATGVLLALLLTGGIVGWRSFHVGSSFPTWTLLAIFGAIGVAFLTSFKPHLARITGPIYAVIEGLVVGAISHAYNATYPGIVVQAAGATLAVAAVMVFLQRSGLVKVTDRMRRVVMTATLGVMLLYGVSLILSVFSKSMPIINDATPIGILFSVLVAGLAAFRLLVDIDFIDKQVKMGAPKDMEWYGAFALTVTLVWLYLELLRLLSKLQRR